MLIGRPILLPTPVAAFRALACIVGEKRFFSVIGYTLVRIFAGFLLGTLAGTVLAAAAGHWPIVEDMLWPFAAVVRSVPVASFIILCLVWLTSRQLAWFISALITFPVVYSNILSGIRSLDRKMNEMAGVFRISGIKRTIWIELPQLKPFILSACSTAIGLSWKAGIAAEVIGIPDGTIGEKLYMAKIYFETPELFAWTAVIVILSVATEKLLIRLMKLGFNAMENL